MAGACAGLRVVEVTRGMPGALAGMLLADAGADVIKAEGNAPDPYLTEPGFHLWNRGKLRVRADVGDDDARARIARLARWADVVIVGVRPGTAERWGLTYDVLSATNPGLVVASVTGFGLTGPHRDAVASEAIVHALTGSMTSPLNGSLRDGPVFVAAHTAAYATAMLCAQGILAALHTRERTGRGQLVDVSLLDGILAYRGYGTMLPVEHKEDFPAAPPAREHRGLRPLFNINQCEDGRWITVAAFTPALAVKSLGVMGLHHLLADTRFVGMPNVFPDDAARDAFLNILWDTFRTRPAEEWIRLFDDQGIPAEPVQTVDEFRNLGQLWANDQA
ncbi:MAG TPA: CoA transferase, partial [Tepidiformaceae bacterium]|nr:CoA transferase [Tepidiformaceae bacterium]